MGGADARTIARRWRELDHRFGIRRSRFDAFVGRKRPELPESGHHGVVHGAHNPPWPTPNVERHDVKLDHAAVATSTGPGSLVCLPLVSPYERWRIIWERLVRQWAWCRGET